MISNGAPLGQDCRRSLAPRDMATSCEVYCSPLLDCRPSPVHHKTAVFTPTPIEKMIIWRFWTGILMLLTARAACDTRTTLYLTWPAPWCRTQVQLTRPRPSTSATPRPVIDARAGFEPAVTAFPEAPTVRLIRLVCRTFSIGLPRRYAAASDVWPRFRSGA